MTLSCSSTDRVGVVVGVEDTSIVGETVGIIGDGLVVYCSQPTKATMRKMVIKTRQTTKPER